METEGVDNFPAWLHWTNGFLYGTGQTAIAVIVAELPYFLAASDGSLGIFLTSGPGSFLDYVPMHHLVVYLGMALALASCAMFYCYQRHLAGKRLRNQGPLHFIPIPMVVSGIIVLGFFYFSYGPGKDYDREPSLVEMLNEVATGNPVATTGITLVSLLGVSLMFLRCRERQPIHSHAKNDSPRRKLRKVKAQDKKPKVESKEVQLSPIIASRQLTGRNKHNKD